MRDPGLSTACSVWSPDGRRFACGGYGEPDATRNGIYTLRTSDGRGLVRVTRPLGFDEPGDYSPRGTHLVFARFSKDERPLGLFVVGTNGRQLRRIAPAAPQLSSGDWSPSGNWILFARRVSAQVHNSLWVVHPDGSGLREIRLQGVPPLWRTTLDTRDKGLHPSPVVTRRNEDHLRHRHPQRCGRGRERLHRQCKREWRDAGHPRRMGGRRAGLGSAALSPTSSDTSS